MPCRPVEDNARPDPFPSFAVLAWLQDEPASDYVDALLQRADAGLEPLHLSVVNAGEVYYRLVKAGRPGEAEDFRSAARRGDFPWHLEDATSGRVWQAAELKAAHAISYADAFAVALACELRAEVVTGDPEILALADRGIVAVDWPASRP